MKKFAGFSLILPTVLALTLPMATVAAQTTKTKATKTPKTSTGSAAPKPNVTGGDPTPIKWPPSAQTVPVIE